jgi:integrase
MKLSPRLLGHIAEYVKRLRPNERGLLLVTRNGTPWDANLLLKHKLYPMLDSLGIERGGLHAFRHTNSTLMDRLGVPLKVRQQRLGHTDPSLTLGVYTHVESEDRSVCGVIGRNSAPNCTQIGDRNKSGIC